MDCLGGGKAPISLEAAGNIVMHAEACIGHKESSNFWRVPSCNNNRQSLKSIRGFMDRKVSNKLQLESNKRHKRKLWMYLLGAVCVVFVLIAACQYAQYISKSLMMQTISNVQTVTQQQQQAFDSFIARDRERIHSYAEDFSRLSSKDVDIIRDKLDVFSSVDAVYSVVNLDTGEYYNNKSPEILQMNEEQLESYRHFSGSGVREPYIGVYTATKMFGYYECFTFEDGVNALVQKGYESDRVSGEFTLSFYNDQGFAWMF